MTISRREFFLATSGAAAGFILPSYYEKVLNYLERFDEPLLESPRNPKIRLYAAKHGVEEYQLNWGDPYADPDLKMTLREYANRYHGGEYGYLDDYFQEPEDVDFDSIADESMVFESWANTDSPTVRAYRLLENLDLGPSLDGVNAIGELQFIEGELAGSDYLGVHTFGLVTVSLLQQRLNDLKTGISIEME